MCCVFFPGFRSHEASQQSVSLPLGKGPGFLDSCQFLWAKTHLIKKQAVTVRKALDWSYGASMS